MRCGLGPSPCGFGPLRLPSLVLVPQASNPAAGSTPADKTTALAVASVRCNKAEVPSFSSLLTADLGISGTAALLSLIADDDFFRLCGAGRDIGFEQVWLMDWGVEVIGPHLIIIIIIIISLASNYVTNKP